LEGTQEYLQIRGSGPLSIEQEILAINGRYWRLTNTIFDSPLVGVVKGRLTTDPSTDGAAQRHVPREECRGEPLISLATQLRETPAWGAPGVNRRIPLG
jgi:hypothetical protein